MNKEQQELLNEAYRKYADSHNYFVDGWLHVIPMEHSKETFINECKINPKFSKKWGLKIEERELSLEERLDLLKKLEIFQERTIDNAKSEMIHSLAVSHNIPTKQLTITYNDKTIETYE